MIKLNLLPILFFIISICSCRKSSPVAVNPPENQHQLSVILNKLYLDGSKTDSAKVFWEHNGKTQVFALLIKNDIFSIDLQQFDEGSGKLTVQLFSNIKSNNQYPHQWLEEKQIVLEHDKSITLYGPSSFEDNQWMPRVMLNDEAGHAAIVALRPEDPYFHVDHLQDDVQELQVNRTYWNTSGIVKIAEGTWQCSFGCIDEREGVTNNSFFSFLPDQIGSRTWNQVEIVVMYVTDENGGGYVLSMSEKVK